MPETVEKMHVLVAEQERFIKELMAKDQASIDDVNRISFHIGFLFGVSAALSRVALARSRPVLGAFLMVYTHARVVWFLFHFF